MRMMFLKFNFTLLINPSCRSTEIQDWLILAVSFRLYSRKCKVIIHIQMISVRERYKAGEMVP